MILDSLGLLHGTDKASGAHDYLNFYEQFLQPLRDQRVTLLEIGVGGCNSLWMWRDYFPRGQIVGLDIESKSEFLGQDRIRIEQGDQADQDVIDRVGRDHGPFDVIVDDGGHDPDAQVFSYQALRRWTKRGALYVLEDVIDDKVGRFLAEVMRAVVFNRAGDSDDPYVREHGDQYEWVAFYRETSVSKLR